MDKRLDDKVAYVTELVDDILELKYLSNLYIHLLSFRTMMSCGKCCNGLLHVNIERKSHVAD